MCGVVLIGDCCVIVAESWGQLAHNHAGLNSVSDVVVCVM